MIFRILEDQYAQKSKEAKAADQRFMQLALLLGRRGLGRTWPNPAVGAVVVKDGVIAGRGWTQPGGRPHAEPEALRRAGEAARGATLYVTLEPCSHFGKSPPCVDAVIASGIARVVSAIEDPNPEVAGQGHAKLRAAGITVDVGLGAAEAAHDHAGHFRRIRDKLVRSLQISLRKRPVDPERVEKMVSAIVRELESGGEAEVSSEAIGEIVMEHLRQLDDVAYVRFASVYRNFREAKDFEAVLGELSAEDDARVAMLRK